METDFMKTFLISQTICVYKLFVFSLCFIDGYALASAENYFLFWSINNL